MENDKIHPRCPNCGSTAQYRDGQCGCGYTAQKEIREVYIVLANSYAHKGFTTLEEARQFVIGLLADDPVAQQIANDQIYIRVRAGNKNLYEVQSVEVEL